MSHTRVLYYLTSSPALNMREAFNALKSTERVSETEKGREKGRERENEWQG